MIADKDQVKALEKYLDLVLIQLGRYLQLKHAMVSVVFPVDKDIFLFNEFIMDLVPDDAQQIDYSNRLGIDEWINSLFLNKIECVRDFQITDDCENSNAGFVFTHFHKGPVTILSIPLSKDDSRLVIISRDSGNMLFQDIETFRATSFLLSAVIRNVLVWSKIKSPELAGLTNYFTDKLPNGFLDLQQTESHLLRLTSHPTIISLGNYEQEINAAVVDLTGKASDLELKAVAGIKSAEKITLKSLLGGSLQGKNIFLSEITPRVSTGKRIFGRPFPAIIKFTSRALAARETAGLLNLEKYYKEIGDMLPPAAEHWVIIDKLKSGDDVVSVIPQVLGISLHDVAKKGWNDADKSQLKEIFAKLKIFLSHIGREESISVPGSQVLLHTYFGNDMRTPIRRAKAKGALAYTFDKFPDLPLIEFCEILIANPLYHFSNIERNALSEELTKLFQNNVASETSKLVFAHGDFHAGNILVDFSESNPAMFVLDFDYVGENYKYYDEATLEVSTVLALASNPDFQSDKFLKEWFVPLVLYLSGEDVDVSENQFVKEFVEVIEALRTRDINDHYKFGLITLLFRFLGNHYNDCSAKGNIQSFEFIGKVGGLYLGLLLKQVMN